MVPVENIDTEGHDVDALGFRSSNVSSLTCFTRLGCDIAPESVRPNQAHALGLCHAIFTLARRLPQLEAGLGARTPRLPVFIGREGNAATFVTWDPNGCSKISRDKPRR